MTRRGFFAAIAAAAAAGVAVPRERPIEIAPARDYLREYVLSHQAFMDALDTVTFQGLGYIREIGVELPKT